MDNLIKVGYKHEHCSRVYGFGGNLVYVLAGMIHIMFNVLLCAEVAKVGVIEAISCAHGVVVHVNVRGA